MTASRLCGSSSAVRDALHASEAGLVHPASTHQLYTPTTPEGNHEIPSAPPHPLATARVCPGRPLEFSTCRSDALADRIPEVLAIASRVDSSLALSGHGHCLVGGTITLGNASFTTQIAIHSGARRTFWWCGASRHWLPTDVNQARRVRSYALGWCGIHRVQANMRTAVLGGLR